MAGQENIRKNRLIMWYSAFRGFYDRRRPEDYDFISRFLFSARSVILVISAQAAIISGILSYIYGAFSVQRFILVFFGFLIAHALSNLSNDYFGYVRGDDTPDSPRRMYTIHPIADNILSREEARLSIVLLLLAGLAIAGALTYMSGIYTLAFLAAGLALLFLYDAAPKPLKYYGLGEVASFLAWGPVMVSGGVYAITGHFFYQSVLVGTPYGLGVMSILWGKHVDQEEYDRSRKIRTMPVLLGGRRALYAGAAIIVAMYIVPVVEILLGTLPITSIIIFANLPLLIYAVRVFRSPRPERPPEGFVGWPLWYHRAALRHNRRYGWLYILALLVPALLAAATGNHAMAAHLFL
ncbi:1,4-dihydroxy-2-naphthoate octaprenyltransferase [Thermogymnomonas acidicola]|uniref:1,4-dihydroxy-2-naphthoate octaprenyltransferase n=1 Tax=Thermogymnomonas acidicola TaxID=399579 RepID=A0AA37F9L1_9ARCH|nr:prenyltransferase [Thermogymnomonas acidicola]GGM70072.1 1,4-dihydroxy-2-naphthoate octaprenyltransferase [Thermogymnomonas acidicola]